MIIFALIELALIFTALWIIITQVIIPAFRGTPVFPMFRRESKLKAVVIEQRQDLVERQIERAIALNEQELNPASSPEEAPIINIEKESTK